MKTFMLTIPRGTSEEVGYLGITYEMRVHKREIMHMIEVNDVKKWIVAKEIGSGGYEHWQIRLQTSNETFFDWIKNNIPKAHVEEATDTWTYERKEGRFWGSEDTPEILGCRFGQPNDFQKKILKRLDKQTVREVDVWYDPEGNKGKTWLTIHLWETGEAMVVPRASTTAEKLSAFVCSAYNGERVVVIDIPRSTKATASLYEAIEELKDGLVFDHRYSGKTRNIRGVKVVVFTNNKLDLKALSKDRWVLNGKKLDEL